MPRLNPVVDERLTRMGADTPAGLANDQIGSRKIPVVFGVEAESGVCFAIGDQREAISHRSRWMISISGQGSGQRGLRNIGPKAAMRQPAISCRSLTLIGRPLSLAPSPVTAS